MIQHRRPPCRVLTHVHAADHQARLLTHAGDLRHRPEGEDRAELIGQLPRLSRRTRYLQRALTAFYTAVALLVSTSILLGVSGLAALGTGFAPIVTALIGSGFLAYGALLLSYEARLSARTTRAEMHFLERLGEHYASLYQEAGGEHAEAAARPRP